MERKSYYDKIYKTINNLMEGEVMRGFLSDNNSGTHPNILKAIEECNIDHELPYGEDIYTEKAKEKIREIFEKNVDVYFVTTGTAANVVGLSGLIRPFDGVICADTAHINVDECGAFERFSGSKLLYVPNRDGKLYIEDIEKFLHSTGDEHQVQPRVISITQCTEVGTVYTIDEIKRLADFAHENNLYLHVDGARIANAIVSLNTNFRELITDTGVDLLSFGGTKNGMMIGEAIISFNPEISKNFKFIRKQGMQLVSKMRFISSQFIAYLEDDLWKKNAINANEMAKYLEEKLKEIKDVDLCRNVEANILFINIPLEWLESLEKIYPLYEEYGQIRLVTSFDTNREDVDKFINTIKKISSK